MSTLNVTRGSDASFVFTWKDVDKAPIDVSGMEVVILDPSTEVAARLSGEITEGISGVVTIFLEGTDPIKTGRYNFRVQLNTLAGQSMATPQLTLVVR